MHVDFLICFECQQAKIRYWEIREDREISEREETVPIGTAGRATLNQLLDSRKIERDIPNKVPNQIPVPMAPSGRNATS